jgi:LysR family glycine cleavage system transcriptional activator
MVTRATTDDLPSMSALRLVEAACRHGNFRRAGRELNVTHSAISQQISRLERQFDVTLFVRDGATMKATPAAEELADGYRRAARALERSLERATARGASRLVISLPASLANPWLRHRLDVFGRELSSAQIEVRRDDIEPNFSRVDAAVVVGEQNRPDAWVEPLFERAVTPVCSPAFQKANGLYKPEHLLRAPLLVHDEEAWRLWFAAAGVAAPETHGSVIDPGSAIGAAVDGYGVALACRVSAGKELEQGRLVQPFPLWASTGVRFQMAWPKEHGRLDQIHAFADWMRREVALSLASELPAAA